MGRSIDLYKDIGAPAEIVAALRLRARSPARTSWRTRAWPRNPPSRRRTRIRSRRARTSAWCTTARCRIRTWCAASSSRSASASRPTTTPKPPAASSNGACARATTSTTAVHRGFAELDGFFTFLMGTDKELLHRARRVRLQAGDRRRDRRLRRHRLGVPLARAPAGRAPRQRVRAEPEEVYSWKA